MIGSAKVTLSNAALVDVSGRFRCTTCSSKARPVSLQQECYDGRVIQLVLTPDQGQTIQ